MLDVACLLSFFGSSANSHKDTIECLNVIDEFVSTTAGLRLQSIDEGAEFKAAVQERFAFLDVHICITDITKKICTEAGDGGELDKVKLLVSIKTVIDKLRGTTLGKPIDSNMKAKILKLLATGQDFLAKELDNVYKVKVTKIKSDTDNMAAMLTNWEPLLEEWNKEALNGPLLLGNPRHQELGPVYQSIRTAFDEYGSACDKLLVDKMHDSIVKEVSEVLTKAAEQLAAAMAVHALLNEEGHDPRHLGRLCADQLKEFTEQEIVIPRILKDRLDANAILKD